MDMDDDKMRKELPDDVYRVAREGGTEKPFSGEHWDRHDDGAYRCRVCGAMLFDSGNKFDSGTGWPSFDRALPGAVTYHDDRSILGARTEVRCAKCGSHLGHVFVDGPTETTGKRYCINSVCLNFDKRSQG